MREEALTRVSHQSQADLTMNHHMQEVESKNTTTLRESYQHVSNVKVHEGGLAIQGNNPGNKQSQMLVKKVRFNKSQGGFIMNHQGKDAKSRDTVASRESFTL